jgi:regulatory protein
VRDDRGVSTEEPGGPTELDQVSAAREWLRRHGVDPGTPPEGERRTDPGPDDSAREGGYARSRRAASSGPTGRSLSARRPRGRRGGPDAPADGGADGDGTDGTPDPDADPEEVARDIVLRKLAVQARTRVELERALQGRDVPEEAAAAVLDRMTEVGLVDDVTFAQDWVTSRQQRRHLSKTALRRELQTKGVDRDVIDDALADVEGADEHRAALDLARRRAATMGGLDRQVAYRRLSGVLARRGFTGSITTRVLAEVLDDSFGDDALAD